MVRAFTPFLVVLHGLFFFFVWAFETGSIPRPSSSDPFMYQHCIISSDQNNLLPPFLTPNPACDVLLCYREPPYRQALYDYQAVYETEMSLRAGDIINCHEDDGGHWYYGTVVSSEHPRPLSSSTTGWIPVNYVEALPAQDRTNVRLYMATESST